MQLDRIAVALRPRNQWESMDLGFRMARQWWRPIWGVWLALYLPAGAIALLAFDNKLHAVLVLWWLKPLFDRAVLHAASRAVFGEECGVAATLRAAREWLRPGLFGALTFGRLDFARSFTIPVSTLEKQSGSAARKRRAALGARVRGSAIWLTLVCVHLETVVLIASVAIIGMLEPSGAEMLPHDDYGQDLRAALRDFLTWKTADALHYMFAVCLVEPFYVTAGFALYLNRRTLLEGWDIEVQFRRIEERLRSTARAAALLLVVLLGGLSAWTGVPATALAQADLPQQAATQQPDPAENSPSAPDSVPAKSPQEEIRAVLAHPDFGMSREVPTWRYLGETADRNPDEPGKPWEIPEAWRNFLLLFADFSQSLLWILAIVAILLVVYALHRYLPEPRIGKAAYRPPDTLFGLDVSPESLPDDVAAAAAAAARAGRAREALSLLYRGALSALVHRYEVALQAGDTEGDCLRAANRSLSQSAADYFGHLVAAWQAAAYAGRFPPPDRVERLCDDWALHFRERASA
jgi:hypothetical protein